MASPSSQRGAAPPTPDQLAAFYKLVDKKVIAGTLARQARDAALSASAAVQAEALFGEISLVLAHLRKCESQCLTNQALLASCVEREVLVRRSWAVLVLLTRLLLRRVEANTLLPGTLKKEELDYAAHVQAALAKAKDDPVLPPALLRAVASTMGYVTLIEAMSRSLDLLRGPLWQPQRRGWLSRLYSKGWTSSLAQPAYQLI